MVLDCDSWEWSRLDISGPSPPPRNSHVACVVNGGRLLVVYGGSSPEVGPMSDVYLLDLEEGAERWIRPKVTGQAPEPREMHAACVLPNTPGDGDWKGDREIIVVGGRGGASVLSDAVVLDAQGLEWVRRGGCRRRGLRAHGGSVAVGSIGRRAPVWRFRGRRAQG